MRTSSLEAVTTSAALLLGALCPAQDKDAAARRTAERLASILDVQELHHPAAQAFAKLGPAALPVLEKTLREGTDMEALGALLCMVGVSGDRDRILGSLERVVADRPKVLKLDERELKVRRDAKARIISPGWGAVHAVLGRHAPESPSAVALLWSMIGGTQHAAAVTMLSRSMARTSPALLRVARALKHGDAQDRERACALLTSDSRTGQPVPEEVGRAIRAVLDGGGSDLSGVEKFSSGGDRQARNAALGFLRVFRMVQAAQRTLKDAAPPAQPAAAPPAPPAKPGARAARAPLQDRLIALLDIEPMVKAAVCVFQHADAEVIPKLAAALEGADAGIAEGAARVLAEGFADNPETAVHLTKALRDRTRSAPCRITALAFLGKGIDADADRFALIRSMTDPAEPAGLRIAAVQALGRASTRRHEVINTLEQLLRGAPDDVARYATMTLGTMFKAPEDDRILMILLRQLRSPDSEMQHAAVLALAGKGGKVQLERLRAREGLDPKVARAIDIALKQRHRELAGFVIADYSDNRIVQTDAGGKVLSTIEGIFGCWDVEVLDNGNYLLTEFSVNRVSERTPAGRVVWQFTDLKNPYDADRLENGNTLIADTFGRRVIEVDPTGRIVWTFAGVHPYDADRLENGNTLIADTHKDRVIEVSPAGDIVWEMKSVPNVHDADRLPNGNTLLTIRMLNEVREVDPKGKTVFQLRSLSSPSDADRLPDGRTVVAENGFVRTFDARGQEVSRQAITWAVEVNPVWKASRAAQVEAAKAGK